MSETTMPFVYEKGSIFMEQSDFENYTYASILIFVALWTAWFFWSYMFHMNIIPERRFQKRTDKGKAQWLQIFASNTSHIFVCTWSFYNLLNPNCENPKPLQMLFDH